MAENESVYPNGLDLLPAFVDEDGTGKGSVIEARVFNVWSDALRNIQADIVYRGGPLGANRCLTDGSGHLTFAGKIYDTGTFDLVPGDRGRWEGVVYPTLNGGGVNTILVSVPYRHWHYDPPTDVFITNFEVWAIANNDTSSWSSPTLLTSGISDDEQANGFTIISQRTGGFLPDTYSCYVKFDWEIGLAVIP